MSLAVLADHMASKGRGPDSMLIHMSPREVQGLQALAMKHGGSLTINPDTGLPEAGFLDKLLPAIIGAGLTMAGVPPNVSAMIVGGVQTVRTGDIGKGIQAGLGAYGGAGLTAGMTAAGESAIGSQAAGQSYLASSVPSVLEGAGAGLSADMAYNLGQAGIDTAGAEASRLAQQAAAERIAAASPFDKLSAGAKAVSDNPMSFANKDNLKYLAAAAGPAIMAGANVQAKGPQTVTKPGMIRPYSYDPYSGGFTAASPYEAAPTRAAEGGLMGMANGGYSPGMLDFTQRSEPVVRMAGGGYAAGGQPSMAEWLDKAGISQEAREKGSPELYEAVNAYHALGSSLDPYRQEDTRDWGAVMAAENPVDALIQQNIPLYGGAGRVDLTDTGGMLVSGAGNPLTSDLSRYKEFGIKLNPDELEEQLAAIGIDTPAGRAKYNRINMLYQQALLNQRPQRMAEGGIAGYADGGPLDVNNPIYQYFAKPETQALLASGNDKAIADALVANKWSLSDVASATGTQDKLGEYANRFVKAEALPTTDASEFMTATGAVGLQDQALADALKASNLSAASQYALTHTLDDAAGLGPTNIAGKPFYDAYGYKAGDAPGDKGGLEGLYTNIDYAADRLQDQINAGKLTVQQAQNLSLAEMERLGINLADVKAATGSDFANLFKPKAETKLPLTCPPGYKLNAAGTACIKEEITKVDTSVVPGGTKLSSATTYDNGAFGNYGSGNKTGTDYLGREVSIATPGDIITNPDDSRTIVPNIPGRPIGGFPGMDAVKSAYTAGGGSLGYIPYAPKTIEEFDAKYNRLTGGSKQAYDYLTGKTPYSPTPYTPTGEVMKPYAESVLGMPVNTSKRMYIFDPATKTYKVNPDYAIPTYDAKGNKTYNVTNKDVITYMATKPAPADFYNWAKTNNLTVEQIAAATGMPITEVQKMLTGGAPADTSASSGSSSSQISDGLATGGLAALAGGGISGSGNLDLHIPLDFGDSGGFGGGFGGAVGTLGGGTPMTSSSTFTGQNNTAGRGYGPASRPDESGGLYKGPMVIPAGLDDSGMGSPEIIARSKANDAARAAAGTNPASLNALAKALGGGSMFANGGATGGQYNLGDYSDGGRLLRGPGDGVSDSIPASIGNKRPARLADGEFVVPARIVSELGNGSTEAGARKLYAMMDRIQAARRGTVGKGRVAKNSRADKHLPA